MSVECLSSAVDLPSSPMIRGLTRKMLPPRFAGGGLYLVKPQFSPPIAPFLLYLLYERIWGEMVKANVHNVILNMSDGVGSRFGADYPRQYRMMGGERQIVEYAIDAVGSSKSSRSDQ